MIARLWQILCCYNKSLLPSALFVKLTPFFSIIAADNADLWQDSKYILI